MSEHNYTIDLTGERFETKISPSTNYGYFEHHRLGDNCGGGLWFNGKELVDYDGTSFLPREVAKKLREAGYEVDDCYDSQID